MVLVPGSPSPRTPAAVRSGIPARVLGVTTAGSPEPPQLVPPAHPPSGERDPRQIRRANDLLSWPSLGWMTIEGAVAVTAGVIAGSVALVGFGIDSAIEGLASVIVIWRFTGSLHRSRTRPSCERRSSWPSSFFLLAPYIAQDAVRTL